MQQMFSYKLDLCHDTNVHYLQPQHYGCVIYDYKNFQTEKISLIFPTFCIFPTILEFPHFSVFSRKSGNAIYIIGANGG